MLLKTKSFNQGARVEKRESNQAREREKDRLHVIDLFCFLIWIINWHFVYWQEYTVNHIAMIKVHSFVLHECNHHHHLHCYCRSPLDLFQCETNEREMVQYRPNSKTKKHCRSIFPSSKSTNAMNISTFHIENDHGDHEKHKYAENFQHFVGLIDFLRNKSIE